MTTRWSQMAAWFALSVMLQPTVSAATVELPSAVRPILGSEAAPVVMVQFADYQCGFCRQFAQQQLPELQRGYIETGQLRLEVRDFPLRQHPRSVPAARAGVCADRQGRYWPMHERLYAPVEALGDADIARYADEVGLDIDRFERCLGDPSTDERLRDDVAAARQALVSGTPAFVVGLERDGRITGTLLVGYYPISVLTGEIDEYVERAAALARREGRPDDAPP